MAKENNPDNELATLRAEKAAREAAEAAIKIKVGNGLTREQAEACLAQDAALAKVRAARGKA